MEKRWRIVSLVGISCSSLCMLGLPLLAVWLPVMRLGWLLNEGIMRWMLMMFMLMFAAGVVSAYQRHRNRLPAIFAVIGGFLMIAVAWHALPHGAGWPGLVSVAVAWVWDWWLMRKNHRHAVTEENSKRPCHV
jgi:uncharacterized membrane protein